MKFILGALAAVSLFVGVAATQPADARCFMTNYGWQCWHPHWNGGPGYWHHRHYWGY